ncbi:kynureninase [Mucilaginibacter sp. KACC 22773]|uniref:kynureninase n=1 Tax=Mucilaginibacter sp. KACC 22773 TaxID=3025671 RepID=UPI0023661DD8|nr:kynureninase [Mucilaginibacter sp. KACC 22773]WDF80565.1 kynureninase [Mucilaginibacter sp. KACC 22773]
MNYQNSLAFAIEQDELDPLKEFRDRFLIPKHNGEDAIYLCGNSLGLQPKSAAQYVADQMANWQNLAVEGWFQGSDPWLEYHKPLAKSVAAIVGANENEVAVMNSLTVNLHLLMVSFYKPDNKKFKIIMEGGAFPSDQYAMESQVKFHGLDPKDAIVEIFPREGEVTLRTEDIVNCINEHADELALVMFSGINYYTGQFFDLPAITKAAHNAGAYAGFDLAHAAGNVPLKLHEWGADFTCWCSYKYMNSGPGGISGIFVHQKHFKDKEMNRFAGWWGYRADKRFLMAPGFDPASGADGWQVSTSPIILLALFKASMAIFDDAGYIDNLRKKSVALTGYLEFLIKEVNKDLGDNVFNIITPADEANRGCQLSIICSRNAKAIFNYLADNGVIGDWREPDVIRLSPVPLYNSFQDVYNTAKHLANAIEAVK